MSSTNLRFAGVLLAIIALCGCKTTFLSNQPVASTEPAYGVVKVNSPEAFERAVEAAEPGATIILADGIWTDFDALFHAKGTLEAPIRLAAETPGQVILSGQSSLRLAGEHLVVSGLVFRDGYTPRSEVISFRKDSETLAFNSRVTATVIDGYSNPDRRQRDLWVGMYGKNNVFDHNHLAGKQNAGPTLAVRLNTQESQENGHRIAYNYFGPRPVFGSNGGETLRVGTSHFSLTDSKTIVENNYFDRCSGEVEIVSSKSGGNIFRSNTFYASRGTLTLRHGNGTLIENNLFDGNGAPYTGGVRVINGDQTVRNNYFKDLTGNRFSGALVVMNGVPNSPINRYHQVDGAIIERNTFDNIAAIELGEGSDAERTAVPINSVFQQNLVVGQDDMSPFSLYDDMSGINFLDNLSAMVPPPEIASGVQVAAELVRVPDDNKITAIQGVGAFGEFGVARGDTGTDWYPKASDGSPFEGGREILLQPGADVLSTALSDARRGDYFVLAAGRYHESKQIVLDVPVTIAAAEGDSPVLSFERPSLFVLTGDGGLALDGLQITGESAPDGKGNSVISTSAVAGSGNHLLSLKSICIEALDVNGGFSVVSAAKGSFFDRIDIADSHIQDVSGTVFKLDQETDDYGIYNSEFLTIVDSSFESVGGSIVSMYRGGSDESTFGPHVDVSGSRFTDVGGQSVPLMVLHGIQKGSFTDNEVSSALPVSVIFTTGLPVFKVSENTVDGNAQDDFSVIMDMRNRK